MGQGSWDGTRTFGDMEGAAGMEQELLGLASGSPCASCVWNPDKGPWGMRKWQTCTYRTAGVKWGMCSVEAVLTAVHT